MFTIPPFTSTGASTDPTYTRGRAQRKASSRDGKVDLTAHTVSGLVCQVQRNHNGPDRQIILSVGDRLLYSSHYAVMWGVPGNVMRIGTRVRNSTDPSCPVGTPGKMTVFASYNGVHRDSVEFYFPAACKSHRHLYRDSTSLPTCRPSRAREAFAKTQSGSGLLGRLEQYHWRMPTSNIAVDHEVAVIGAGFSGIGAAIKLDRAGFSDFVVLEEGDGVGGCLALEHLPGDRRRHPFVQLPVLVRETQ